MKANMLLWAFSLLIVVNGSLLPTLDVQALMCDHDETQEDVFHEQFWDRMKIVAEVTLIIVVVLWTLINCRYFLVLHRYYEYITSLMMIFALPIVYTIMSYFSIHDRNNNGHLDLIKSFYEVFLLFGVFGLMKSFAAYDSEAKFYRPYVLYEAVKAHEKVSLFKMPKDDVDLSTLKWWQKILLRGKKIFFFPLNTTEQARHFVEYINKSLWIFGGIRLVTLIVDLVVSPPDWLTLFLETLGVVSMTVAIAYNYLFVHVIKHEIPEIKPARKFWSVKIFLSLTFYQDYILHWVLYSDYAAGWEYVNESIKDDVIIWTGDALICVEMILFCLLLAWSFPYSSFIKVEVLVGAKLAKKYREQAAARDLEDPQKKPDAKQEIEIVTKTKSKKDLDETMDENKYLPKSPIDLGDEKNMSHQQQKDFL